MFLENQVISFDSEDTFIKQFAIPSTYYFYISSSISSPPSTFVQRRKIGKNFSLFFSLLPTRVYTRHVSFSNVSFHWWMDHYIPSCRVFAPRTCHERRSTDLTPRDATAATLSNRMKHPPPRCRHSYGMHALPHPTSSGTYRLDGRSVVDVFLAEGRVITGIFYRQKEIFIQGTRRMIEEAPTLEEDDGTFLSIPEGWRVRF